MKLDKCVFKPVDGMVAPFAGAWIEITYRKLNRQRSESLPSRERGLKSDRKERVIFHIESLPSRERGLKLIEAAVKQMKIESLPSRERGLKSDRHGIKLYCPCRSLRGSVD